MLALLTLLFATMATCRITELDGEHEPAWHLSNKDFNIVSLYDNTSERGIEHKEVFRQAEAIYR